MKNRYLKFCDYVAKACGAFAVLALLLSILVIVELVKLMLAWNGYMIFYQKKM